MQRPLGVTIVSVLLFGNAALFAALAILTLTGGDPTAQFGAYRPSGAAAMGSFLPLYYGGMAAVLFVVARGLWKLRGWARIVLIVLVILPLPLWLAEVAQVMQSPKPAKVALAALQLGLSVFWLWYLFRPGVREAFKSRPTYAAAA